MPSFCPALLYKRFSSKFESKGQGLLKKDVVAAQSLCLGIIGYTANDFHSN